MVETSCHEYATVCIYTCVIFSWEKQWALLVMCTCLHLTRPYTLEVLGQGEFGCVGFLRGAYLFSWNGNIAFIFWVI